MSKAPFKVGDTVQITVRANPTWALVRSKVIKLREADDSPDSNDYFEIQHPQRGVGGFFGFDSAIVITSAVPSVKSGTQLDKVRNLTLGHSCWTLSAISAATGASEAAASARLRDLRALGYNVKCHKVHGEKARQYTVTEQEVATA